MEPAELGSWAVMVGAVVGLTEAVKRTFPRMDKRWVPLIAGAFGVAWTFGLKYGGNDFVTFALGLGVGLAAIGLYSGVRAASGR